MRGLIIIIILFLSSATHAQVERDTVLSRCPVYITDTVSSNNYFIAGRPATLKVYRVKGDLTIVVEQRDQFFSLFFHERKLRNTTYDITPGSKGRSEVESSYTFKSGDQVAYIALSDGTVQSTWDKEKKMWKVTVNGVLTSMSDRTLSYYKVKAEYMIK
jgi:hypothetical protein